MHSQLYKNLMNSREWRALRTSWLSDHPLCARCAEQGYVRAAQCVHHLTPIESGRTDEDCRALAFSPTNLQSLCYQCHADIHAAERSHSREAHANRERERLERWKQRHAKPPGE